MSETVVAPTAVPETVEATPAVAPVEETPAAATEEAATKVEEPATTTEAVEEAAAPAVPAKEEAAVAPAPTPSKSTPSKRLSLLLGKAKNFVDKVAEKKPTTASSSKKETATPVVSEEPTTIIEEPETTTEVPATTTEEVATNEPEVKAPKFEKRKSILSGIFRNKVKNLYTKFWVGSELLFFFYLHKTPTTKIVLRVVRTWFLSWSVPKEGVQTASCCWCDPRKKKFLCLVPSL
jgi:hypothetical protein